MPGTPETPGKLRTQRTPGTPRTPEAQGTPGTPRTPRTQGTPETPGTPRTPGIPEIPRTLLKWALFRVHIRKLLVQYVRVISTSSDYHINLCLNLVRFSKH